MFENEKWLLECDRQIHAAGIMNSVGNDSSPHFQQLCWRRVLACYLVRAVSITLATHRACGSRFVAIDLISLGMSDLEQDIEFDWLLEASLKRRLAQMFLASIELFKLLIPLQNTLLQYQALSAPSDNNDRQKSLLGRLEECETEISSWMVRNKDLLDSSVECYLSPTASDAELLTAKRAFLIKKAVSKLLYEYVTLTAAQTVRSYHVIFFKMDCAKFMLDFPSPYYIK